MTPQEALRQLVERLHSTNEPDIELISDVGCGDLENLIREHGEELWPEVERLARADPVFRRSLRSVWAYESPEFERRDQLLRELGEHWPVTVRFVVQPEDFLPEPLVSWRAIEIEGEPPARQLSRVLREIADWYDRGLNQARNPILANKSIWRLFFAWSQTVWALERAWHRVGVATEGPTFRSALEAVEPFRASEQARWNAFLAATMGQLPNDAE